MNFISKLGDRRCVLFNVHRSPIHLIAAMVDHEMIKYWLKSLYEKHVKSSPLHIKLSVLR
jgi:hypothetical protein